MLLEESKRVGISLEAARSEALVSAIEGREEVLPLNNFQNLLPLLLGGVNTSRVVRADMEHDEGVVLAVVQIFAETIEVKSLVLGVEVSVGLVVVTNELSKGSVDGPSLSRDHDINIFVGVPVGKEGES